MRRPPSAKSPAVPAARPFKSGHAGQDISKRRDGQPRDIRQADDERKRRFARDMARSVFGRFYWDDRLQDELGRQLVRTKQRHPVRRLHGGAS